MDMYNMNVQQCVLLYHYTDWKGLVGIMQSGEIWPSTNSTTDALYGNGVYLTSKDPRAHTMSQIAQNNYGGNPIPFYNAVGAYTVVPAWVAKMNEGVAMYAVELKIPANLVMGVQSDPDVWLYPSSWGNLQLSSFHTGLVFQGTTPDSPYMYIQWNMQSMNPVGMNMNMNMNMNLQSSTPQPMVHNPLGMNMMNMNMNVQSSTPQPINPLGMAMMNMNMNLQSSTPQPINPLGMNMNMNMNNMNMNMNMNMLPVPQWP